MYAKLYSARGEKENRIKAQQLGLSANRTSCHRWWLSQLRSLVSILAHTLVETLRRIALAKMGLATACVDTIGLKLRKVVAMILRNTCRTRPLL